ncbi:MAG: Flp family type IVb pilin [Chloroflexota bacterium]|jgi:pilus assembly protein Flp/PilA
MEMLRKFFRDEEGANLVEYALLITVIALVVYAGATALGTSIDAWFDAMAGKVGEWTPS